MYRLGQIVTIIDTKRRHIALTDSLPAKGTKVRVYRSAPAERDLGMPGYYYIVTSLDKRLVWYVHEQNLLDKQRKLPTWL